jgi:hypothetical protein
MQKFKPARGKKSASKAPPGGLPCAILIIAGVLLVMFFMYFVLRNANG